MVETFNFPQNNLNSTKLEIYGQKKRKRKKKKKLRSLLHLKAVSNFE